MKRSSQLILYFPQSVTKNILASKTSGSVPYLSSFKVDPGILLKFQYLASMI